LAKGRGEKVFWREGRGRVQVRHVTYGRWRRWAGGMFLSHVGDGVKCGLPSGSVKGHHALRGGISGVRKGGELETKRGGTRFWDGSGGGNQKFFETWDNGLESWGFLARRIFQKNERGRRDGRQLEKSAIDLKRGKIDKRKGGEGLG